MKEITQPTNIAVPKETDPMAWAKFERISSEWIRYVAPQVGLDPQKLILAQVLECIVGDDRSAFSYFFSPKKADLFKKRIFERMDWELSLPETPENIKKQIRKTMSKTENLDFTKNDQWKMAIKIWEKPNRSIRV